jgi:hypothetical protein
MSNDERNQNAQRPSLANSFFVSLQHREAHWHCLGEIFTQPSCFSRVDLLSFGVHRKPIRRILGALLPARRGGSWFLIGLGIFLGSLGLALALRFARANSQPQAQTSKLVEANGMRFTRLPFRPGLSPDDKMTANLESLNLQQALAMYAELTGRKLLPARGGWGQTLARDARNELSGLGLVKRETEVSSGIIIHGDGIFSAAEVKAGVEKWFEMNGVYIVAQGTNTFSAVLKAESRSQ